MIRTIIVIIFVAFLTACAGMGGIDSGVKITKAQIDALEPGKTTLDEVKELWGPPSGETLMGGGLMVTYSHMKSESTTNPLIYMVPLGAVLLDERGSHSTKMEGVSMRFNKELILIERPTISKSSHTTKY
jgi:hypothetical protein